MPQVLESERERRAFLAEHKHMGDVYAKLRGALITCSLTIITSSRLCMFFNHYNLFLGLLFYWPIHILAYAFTKVFFNFRFII